MRALLPTFLVFAICLSAMGNTIIQFDFEGTAGVDLPSDLDDTGSWGPFTHVEGTDPNATIQYSADAPPLAPGASALFTAGSLDSDGSDIIFLDAAAQDLNLGNYGSGLTVEAFVKASPTGDSYRCVFSEGIALKMYITGTTLAVDRKWGPGAWNVNVTHIEANFAGKFGQWHHVAVTWDPVPDTSGNRLKIYINGSQAAASPGNSSPTINEVSPSGFAIGGYVRSSNGTSDQYWAGNIDSFRLVDAGLSAADFPVVAGDLAWRPSPHNTASAVAPDVVLGWKAGIGAAARDIYFGETFTAVNTADNTLPVGTSVYKGRLAAPGTSYDPPGNLGFGETFYWRIDEVDGGGGIHKGRVWQFTTAGKAANPSPADFAANIPLNATLSWTAGPAAVSHDVYFGTSFVDVNDADNTWPVGTSVYKGNRTATTFNPGALALDRTYYWRIDEVDGGTPMKGQVWQFSTIDQIMWEDFESYTNTPDLLRTWDEGGGAWVTLSMDNTHGGAKSLEINYFNQDSFVYSEGLRQLASAEDWLAAGARSMELFFGGPSANNPDTLYVVVGDSSGKTAIVDYPGSPDDIAAAEWIPWQIDFQEFTGVNLNAVKTFAAGVGDRNGTVPSGTTGFLYVDDVALYAPRCLPGASGEADLNGDCTVDYGDLSVMAGDWLKREMSVQAQAPNPAGLQAYYTFDQTSGTTALDASGNNRHATLDAGGAGAWDASGASAGCLRFDGTFKATVPQSVFAGINAAITICTWVNGDTVVQPDPNWGMIFNGKTATEERMLLAHCPTEDGEVMFESSGYRIQRLLWTGADAADWEGDWNHYAFLVDTGRGVTELYLNGLLVDQGPASTPIGGITTFTIGWGSLGAPAVNYPYFGKLDEFRVYNYGLSQAQVVHTAGLTSLTVPLDSDADLFEDGAIDLGDFAVMGGQWLQTQLWP